jgi:hypothetical protein
MALIVKVEGVPLVTSGSTIRRGFTWVDDPT